MRLDHFRGFEAYWAIPAEEETAVKGEWIKAPGLALFRALEAALGPLPLVAEDLGLITPEVEALRLELGMPGMKVLQFGFCQQRRAHPPAAPLHSCYRGLHGHARQRHHAGLVEYSEQSGTRSRRSARRPCRQSPRLAAHPRRAGKRGRDCHRSRAGPAGAGLRGAHEYAAGSGRKLELARAGELLDRRIGRQLAALAEVTDRDNDPLGKAGNEGTREQ